MCEDNEQVIRTPMVEIAWFKKCQQLAIADVIYVEGLGLCSHQPLLREKIVPGKHRVADLQGKIHIVDTPQLFMPFPGEVDLYWRKFKGFHG